MSRTVSPAAATTAVLFGPCTSTPPPPTFSCAPAGPARTPKAAKAKTGTILLRMLVRMCLAHVDGEVADAERGSDGLVEDRLQLGQRLDRGGLVDVSAA